MAISLDPTVDATVAYGGKDYVITNVLDMYTVLGKERGTGRVKTLPVHDLKPTEGVNTEDEKKVKHDLLTMPDEKWEIAEDRYDAIEPLLKKTNRTREDVADRAKEVGKSTNTLYRWLKRFEEGGYVTDLVPHEPGKTGKRMSEELEVIIEAAVTERYLSRPKPPVQDTINEVRIQCRNAKLTPPSGSTIRRRIRAIDARKRMEKRDGKEAADQKYEARTGEFPNGTFPLETVQIDHTPVDLELVDDIYRLPIGRPYITLAIDVYSRMCLGFYVSFDHPNAMAVGLCLTRAFLPKKEWLAQYGVEEDWPCWGLPEMVHADTAKEFKGKMLKRACKEYNIGTDFRAKGRKHWGGHIERLMDTFAIDIHTVPGTTFHNIQEKGDYDSAGNAILTLSEFEKWFVQLLIKYHNRPHSELLTSPLAKYAEGIFGSDNQPARGLPPIVLHKERMRLDFMPFYDKATVQRSYGIRFNYVDYYSDVLGTWVGSVDPDTGKTRKFIIRYDPRDMSKIYFLDPELNIYFEIPYANPTRPPASLWEIRRVARQLRKDGLEKINEDDIFDAIIKMREIEAEAARDTRSARRNVQRRSGHQAVSAAGETTPTSSMTHLNQPPIDVDALEPYDIEES